MPEITLAKGSAPLSVKLSLDLGAYCEAYQSWCSSQAEYTTAGLDMITRSPSSEDCMAAFNKFVFQTERDGLMSEVTGANGAVHWKKIKALLNEQCKAYLSTQAQLSLSLTRPDEEEPTVPLAIECLDEGFVELLKNSIDAMLKQWQAHTAVNMLLEMDIVLTIEDEKTMVVTIIDNAGGFSDSYLGAFEPYIKTKAYKSEIGADEKQQFCGFLLGGEGKGMARICNYIKDGEILERLGISRPVYLVPQGSTDIFIANNHLKRGAQITLTSPLSPFVRVVLSNTKIMHSLTSKPSFFPLPPPHLRRYGKKSGAPLEVVESLGHTSSPEDMCFLAAPNGKEKYADKVDGGRDGFDSVRVFSC